MNWIRSTWDPWCKMLKVKEESSRWCTVNSPKWNYRYIPQREGEKSGGIQELLLTFIQTASKRLKTCKQSINPKPTVAGIFTIGAGGSNPNREASRTFKADQVRRYSGDVIAALKMLHSEYSDIVAKQPCTDVDFRIIIDKLKTTSKKAAALSSEAKNMIEDAIEAGMTDMANKSWCLSEAGQGHGVGGGDHHQWGTGELGVELVLWRK